MTQVTSQIISSAPYKLIFSLIINALSDIVARIDRFLSPHNVLLQPFPSSLTHLLSLPVLCLCVVTDVYV